ncbi:MAG: extracellular solute-binding protein [Clostridia bacterium]|nr:extracellular solute-binding protein [Clostridia bacterium]
MKTRIISMILLICMAVCAFGGCDNSSDEPEYKIELSSKSLTLKEGESHKLTASVTPDDGEYSLRWRTSDSAVVAVSKGSVTGVSEGTAVVEAYLSTGESAECIVTVLADNDIDPDDESNKDDDESDKDDDKDNEGEDNNGNSTGGSGSGNTGNIDNVISYNGEPVTVTFYHYMNSSQREILDAAIERFNEIYPNITIDHSSYGSSDDLHYRILTELMVGQKPNLAISYPDHIASYKMAGALLPLDGYINSYDMSTNGNGDPIQMGYSDEERSSFISSFFAEGQCYDVQGTTYSLPFFKSTEVMYYNKTFFEQNGLAVPATWDEMEVLCEYIKSVYPESMPLVFDSESNLFITMAYQLRSPISNVNGNILFDNSVNMHFVKMLRNWYDSGYFTTLELIGSYASDIFNYGGCYMAIGSSASAAYYGPTKGSFEVGVAPVPRFDTENPKYISQGSSICMMDVDDQSNAAAWLFMKFLTTDVEFQTEIAILNGYMPVTTSVLDNTRYQQFLATSTDNRALVLNLFHNMDSSSFISTPAFQGSYYLRQQLSYLMRACLITKYTDLDSMISEKFAYYKEEILNEIR